MATHSYVGYFDKELGKIKYIFSNYSDFSVCTLKNTLKTYEDVKEFVNRGHMNSVRFELDKEDILSGNKDFLKEAVNKNIYDKWGEPFIASNPSEIRTSDRHLVLYCFLFQDNEWKEHFYQKKWKNFRFKH